MKEKHKKYLGVDWGEKRIGLALGDSETKIATPYKVVGNIDEVVEVMQDEDVDIIVIGRPTPITNLKITNKEYNKFVNELKEKISIPVKAVDERLSSKAADALEGDKKTKAPRDAVAAMLILQTYLDSSQN